MQEIRTAITNRSSLPSLASLLAFESAATHLSFSEAAKHLGRTRSAVSHAISEIESKFGCQLFTRCGSHITLTSVGEAYLQEVRKAIRILSTSGEQLINNNENEVLNIHMTPVMAYMALVPNLREFKEIFKKQKVNMTISRELADWEHNPPDVEIRLAGNKAKLTESTMLGTICAVPYCSIELTTNDNPIREISDLKNATLIQDNYCPDYWPEWLSKAGYHELKPKQTISMSDPRSILEAVFAGHGLAFYPYPFILKQKYYGTKLVIPFGAKTMLEWNYHFVKNDKRSDKKTVKLFMDWFSEKFRQVSE